jgi:hypothetical protein
MAGQVTTDQESGFFLIGESLFRLAYRQRMVEYRARFDANKNVQDLMKAKRLLIAGEEEFKNAMYWHTENVNCKYFIVTYSTIIEQFSSS